MKIFISIASYQDPLLETTILSAFDKAHMPQNLHFGVCDQSSNPIDINSRELGIKMSYENINPNLSEGPCWARHRIQDMYQEEEFFLQIDSHMQFEDGWDTYLIRYITKIQSESFDDNILPIISCYPRAFDVIDLEAGIYKLHDEVLLNHIAASLYNQHLHLHQRHHSMYLLWENLPMLLEFSQ